MVHFYVTKLKNLEKRKARVIEEIEYFENKLNELEKERREKSRLYQKKLREQSKNE